MNAIEWTAYLEMHGMGEVHEAASRLAGAPLFAENSFMTEKQRAAIERRNQVQAEYRARKRLSSAERVANMMAAVTK